MNAELSLLLPDVDDALKGLGPLFHQLDGKAVLVTGARGYLGRFVIAALVRANDFLSTPCRIYALDSLLVQPDDKREDWRSVPNLRFIKHDVRHEVGNGDGALWGDKLDYVWHLAGIASPHWYAKMPLATIDVAVQGTRNMLELARKHDARFLFTSSSEVYQTASVVPTPESYVGAIPSLTERSCYDVSKLMGETLCFALATRPGGGHTLHCNIVRIFNSFGVTMGEHDRRILTRIASALKRNDTKQPLTVYAQPGGRLPSRTYTPVANTLSGLLRVALSGEPLDALSQTKGVYNIGLDTPELTVPELCSRIAQVTGSEVAYEFKPTPDNYTTEPLRRCPDIGKLRALGFEAVTDLDEGLRRFFRWTATAYTGEL